MGHRLAHPSSELHLFVPAGRRSHGWTPHESARPTDLSLPARRNKDALVLIDTGFGLRDVADPRARLSRFFLTLLSPDFREEFTALRQIAAFGYDPRDVRHIVLTHLDFDHAGGLDDFPHARVHMLSKEREVAEAQRTLLDRMRYRPRTAHHASSVLPAGPVRA